jgi:hypothetical protein
MTPFERIFGNEIRWWPIRMISRFANARNKQRSMDMSGLSLIIPVETGDKRPDALVEALHGKPTVDLEILIAAPAEIAVALELEALRAIDPRVRLLVPREKVVSTLSLWTKAVQAAKGDWIALIRPDDIFEPEALSVAEFINSKMGGVDAIGWNALQISPNAEPGKSASVAIPTKYDMVEFNKTDMLKSFFLWEGSINVPKMPYGLYHAILSRELAQTIADTIEASGREHQLAHYEWSARSVLIAEKLAFCSRPLSVISTRPYVTPQASIAQHGFPFNATIGLTAGIAEIQYAVFAEMGALWTGAQENFVRACVIDCMLETEPQVFNDKCNAYFRALKLWEGGQHAGFFRPQFTADRPLDTRRGLHGNHLMIDRHIAGARDAREFYSVVRNFLVPIGLICGAKAP